jgi:formylglycine-generating enzyme required for sulfatase activity
MHGNVWEWCEDSHPNKYKGVAISGSVWNGGDEKNNFIKGGAWNHHHSACCSGERYSFTAMRGMSHCVGFRVVS